MPTSANIHSVNTETKTCIVTIRDGDDLVVDNSNIGLELNSDGSANTEWIYSKVSSYIADHRKAKERSRSSFISVNIGDKP